MSGAWPGLPASKTSAPSAVPGLHIPKPRVRWGCAECDVYESAVDAPLCFVCGALMAVPGAKPTEVRSDLDVRLSPYFPFPIY